MDDDEQKGYRWETEYEKTWEAIKETEDGLIQPNIDEMLRKAKRRGILERQKLRLGMMRHLYVIIDMSEAMVEMDLKPTRKTVTLKLLETFFDQFFDQNPISQVGIIVTRNKRAEKVSDLSGNPKTHLETLKKLKDVACVGEPSLQNSLDLGYQSLKNMPRHTSKEILVIMGSLTTCDPSDIQETIDALHSHNVRCSVVGLSAEVRICRVLAKTTQGRYDVILDEHHMKETIMQHLSPPPATQNTESSLIRMGFPEGVTGNDGLPSMCVCHLSDNTNFSRSGYFCPQCNSKYCDLPVECQVCGLTLASAAHLARSYHHLFPVSIFKEDTNQGNCFGCKIDATVGATCETCSNYFCIDCDVFIHDSMHLCPGCASKHVK
ncbi:General transcription factor IIH subunit 2 [Halotydeus destructor]|nr:General transcription factor IIH subunit 2 [Halotydeus destructor]